MARRIDIELTSLRPDGSWTWRAAGAREPKGLIDATLVPAGSAVASVLKAEVETDLDGSRVLAVIPPKAKAERTGLLEILPSDKPFEPVTQKLAPKGRGPRDGDRRGPRRRDGKPGEGRRDRAETGGPSDRPRRKFFETPPELPQRPKPKRVRPQRAHLDAVLAELPEAHRAIAEKVVNGGVPAVRTAIEEQNKAAVAEGREKIKADGLVSIAENLLPRLRTAEWLDRAEAAERIITEVDIRDLRSIVVAGESLSGHDDRTRALLAAMKAGLAARQDAETKLWLDDIEQLTRIGRVVRALRLSSQPPKAGVPFPPALAAQLVDATVAALVVDAPAERWITLLENAAFSPVHSRVLPAAVPAVVTEDLLKTVTRLGPLMPQVAALFGVTVDPKARPPRMLPPSRGAAAKKGAKPAREAKSTDTSAPRAPRAEKPVRSSTPEAEKRISDDAVVDSAVAPEESSPATGPELPATDAADVAAADAG